MNAQPYDVLIIGGGVSGTALLYSLAKFTSLDKLALIEKYDDVALVNSRGTHNSQTIHVGDIETNYTIEKAVQVKQAASLLTNYASKLENRDEVIFKFQKMVIGVGPKECDFIRKRYEVFKEHFPYMQLMDAKQLAEVEPTIVEGRTEEIVGMVALDEYSAVDYGKLAQSFVTEVRKIEGKQLDIKLGEKVATISEKDKLFTVKTGKGEYQARYVVVSAGGHSLLLAQQMGYGLDFSCLPMAGSFYFAPEVLRGKVYTVQNDKLPFAAIHGDPDVLAKGKTRFGPTALMLPMLERYKPSTIWEFFKTLRLDMNVVKVMWDLFKVSDIRNYIFKNFLFEVPGIRRRLFLRDARKIIPNLQLSDIQFAEGFGGIRPQIIDKTQRKLMLGEAKINPGTGIVFNMTPSPGATTCLRNAEKDMRLACEYLGATINEELFEQILLK